MPPSMYLHIYLKKNFLFFLFIEDQLLMILADLLIAGISTTSTALDFLFRNMMVYQECQKSLKTELDKIVGHDRLPDLNDRPQ